MMSALRLYLRFVEVLEVRVVRRNHQQVAARAQRLPVGLHASIEAVELRVLRIRLRIDLARRGIALPAGLARLLRGIGENLRLLLVRLGTNPIRSLYTLGAQLHGL